MLKEVVDRTKLEIEEDDMYQCLQFIGKKMYIMHRWLIAAQMNEIQM